MALPLLQSGGGGGSSAVSWNTIGNATAGLTLSNAGFTSTFNQTSAVAWLWANTTIASAITTNASPLLELAANYWTGAASAVDLWTISSSLAAGTNAISTLAIGHSGSSNASSAVSVPNLVLSSNVSSIQWVNGNFGLLTTSTNYMRFLMNGNSHFAVDPNGNALCTSVLGFNNSNSLTASDTGISWLAATSLAVGNGTAGDFTGSLKLNSVTEASANGATWTQGQASELLTLSTIALTTDTAANLLPANAIIESVVCRVTTTITTTTNWAVGDATISNRFATANATLVAGTTSVGLNQCDLTGTSGPKQVAAAKVRITCTGANPGAGVIRITVFYRQFVAPTS